MMLENFFRSKKTSLTLAPMTSIFLNLSMSAKAALTNRNLALGPKEVRQIPILSASMNSLRSASRKGMLFQPDVDDDGRNIDETNHNGENSHANGKDGCEPGSGLEHHEPARDGCGQR